QAVPEAQLSGLQPGERRLAHITHFVLPGWTAEWLLYMLDMQGVAGSNGSACTAGVAQASHVLLAMGKSEEDSAATLRFSMGPGTTVADLAEVVRVLPDAVVRSQRARQVSDAKRNAG